MAESEHGGQFTAPGAIKIEACSISNFDGSENRDIRYLVLEFNVYRSIFSDHIRGDLIVSDALSLQTRMPIVGEEKISLSYSTPAMNSQSAENKKVEIQGVITSMQHVTWENVRNVVYRLTFVSQYQMVNLMQLVKISFGPDTISNIAKKIAKDYLQIEQKFEVEETEGKHKFVMPSWSPFRCMTFLCKEAFSAQHKAGNFLFWEGVDGHFFKTIDSLIAKGPAKTSDYYVTEQSLFAPPGTDAQAPANAPTGSAEKPPNPKEWRYIFQLQMHQMFDVEEALRNGCYDNTVLWVDTLMQQYEAQKVGEQDFFSYTKNKGANKLLGGHQLISEKALHGRGRGDSHVRFIHANPNQTWEQHQNTPRKRQEKLPYLISATEQLMAVRFDLHVPGDTNRRVGDVIEIELHEFGGTDDIKKELHKYVKGRYLVTAIRDKYTFNKGFHTTMEVVKNAYEAKIEKAPLPQGQQTDPPKMPDLPPELWGEDNIEVEDVGEETPTTTDDTPTTTG